MRRFLFYVLISALAFPPGASPAWRIMPGLTVVNDQNPDAPYYYCAATPASVFRFGGDVFQAPLLPAAPQNETEGYFLDALKKYLHPHGGLGRLITLGGVPPDAVAYLRSYFGVAADDVWEINGSPVVAAAELSRGWTKSEYVVISPYRTAPSLQDLLSAANGASLAAFYNAPLFFAGGEGLSPATAEAVLALRPDKAVLIDVGGSLPASLPQQLDEMSIDVVANLTTEGQVVSYVNAVTGDEPPVLCGFRGREQIPAAAFAAARYGGYVLEVPPSISATTTATWRDAAALLPRSREKLPRPYALPDAVRDGEQAVADEFYFWLKGLGGCDPQRLEYVLTFAPPGGDEGLPYVFERAITGDPATPAEDGAVAGRFPNAGPTNLVSVNFTSAYRALVFANPRPRHMTFAGVAYMAQNTVSCPDDFIDNYGRHHKVNEIYGCRTGGYDDAGVFQDFRDFGYSPALHDGRHAGVGAHPLVPTAELAGFQDDVREGTGFFYESSHGSSGGFYPFDVDDGVADNVSWGQPDWPGGSLGLVNYDGNLFSYNRWNEMTGTNAGLIACFNACNVGEGIMNEVVLRHLGAASVSSYTSVSFQGSGWYWCTFVNRLLEHGDTLGEAAAYATAQVSEIFPAGRTGVDSTIRYVLAGDPFMGYYRPTWSSPPAADADGDYGGHNPGGAGPLAAAVEAAAGEANVVVRWRARSKRELAGWDLYRARGRDLAAKPGGGSAGLPVRVNSSLIRGSSPFAYADGGVANGSEYYYWLEAVEPNGRAFRQGPYYAAPVTDYGKTTFFLAQNYPNPCRLSTNVVFVAPAAKNARLEVYDLAGRLVRRLLSGEVVSGGHTVSWDLRDDGGKAVAPGVYIYRLDVGGETATKRLVVTR